ncbi:MAG: LuxR C-terminal-related transcriptional regulator [Pseudomonadota bacterium]
MQRLRTPDGRYRYTYVSPGVRETFGLDPDDLMSADGVRHDWLHDDDRPRFVAALERSAETLETLDQEVRVHLPDGRFKWVRSIGHPRRLEDGTVIWDGVALDVTDRREALEALERTLSKARLDEVSDGRFAAIAAQDVVAPFDHLQAAMDRLRVGAPSDDPAVRQAVSAFDSFAAAFGAAVNLVAAGQPTGGQGPIPSSNEDLSGLTRRQGEVLVWMRRGLSNRDIAARMGIGEGTVKLHVSAILRKLGVKNRTMAVMRNGTGAVQDGDVQ